MKKIEFIVILFLITSCNSSDIKFAIDTNYISEIDSFFADKMKERQGDYLQLVALHKLGVADRFGKDTINELSLNIDYLPSTIGVIFTHPQSFFVPHHGVLVKDKNDSIISNYTLNYNEYGSSEKLHYEDLSWQIITRSEQKYLRVWDAKNPAINAFKGFDTFELNSDFIFDADFTYYQKEKIEIVKAEVDGKRSTNFIGKVSFTYNNEPYSLEVGSDGFTMVGDATTGETTYGGGRYMYVTLPKTSGKIVLDFNTLYNPPCSFSEFTTCLYPPRQNHLPFRILAGEKINKIN